jgi:selenocysteine-specific elongation factor
MPAAHTGRVRGIQAHGLKSDTGHAGQRLAVNLQGVDLEQVSRGDVVVPRDVFRTTRRLDVRLNHLSSASRDLKHRSFVRFHSGTSEVAAQIILIDRNVLAPGDTAFAQLRLAEPLLLVSGDPYIIRAASPPATIGGGIVLDPFPPARRRRSDDAIKLLESLDSAEHQKTSMLLVSQSLLSGVGLDEITLRGGIPRRQAESALQGLLAAGDIVQMTRDPRIFISRQALDCLKQMTVNELTTFLSANPLKQGMSKEELKTRLPKRSDQRFFAPILSELEKEGMLASDRDLVKPAAAARQASKAVGGLSGKITDNLRAAGMEPPTIKELIENLKTNEKDLRDHLSILVREGAVSRVSADIFYDSCVLDEVRQKLVSCLQDKGEIGPSEFREITGLSRKFMIPLLEFFDGEKLTIRVGEKRILRKR